MEDFVFPSFRDTPLRGSHRTSIYGSSGKHTQAAQSIDPVADLKELEAVEDLSNAKEPAKAPLPTPKEVSICSLRCGDTYSSGG